MGQVNFTLAASAAATIGSYQRVVSNITNQFIVNPNGAPAGVNGYVFDVIDDEEVFLDADITDSWVETNSAIQDHIAIKPVKFTLRGYVGELKELLDIAPLNVLSSVQGLVSLTQTLPVWSTQAQQVFSGITHTIQQTEQAVVQVSSIANLIHQLSPTLTAQQSAYATFYGMWSNRILCTIQTPYGLLTKMAIESVRTLQSGKTRIISDFSVTFKQIQEVSTAVVESNIGNPNPAGSATQSSPQDTLAALTSQGAKDTNPIFDTNRGSGNSYQLDQTPSPSGRIADNISLLPTTSGADTAGVPDYAGTSIPVSPQTSFTTNPDIIGTLTPTPVAPQVNPVVPQFSNGQYQSPLNTGTTNLQSLPVPHFQPNTPHLGPVGPVGGLLI